MQGGETGQIPPLQRLPPVRSEDGSPLSVDKQLRIVFKLQVFHTVFGLRSPDVPLRGSHNSRTRYRILGCHHRMGKNRVDLLTFRTLIHLLLLSSSLFIIIIIIIYVIYINTFNFCDFMHLVI